MEVKKNLSFALVIGLGLLGVAGAYIGLRYVQDSNYENLRVSYESDANLDGGIEDLTVFDDRMEETDSEVILEEPHMFHKEY